MNTELQKMREDRYYDSYSDEQLLKTIEWEKEGHEKGIDRIKRAVSKNVEQGAEHTTRYGASLKRDKIHDLAVNIKAMCDHQRDKGAGRRAIAWAVLSELDHYLVANYALEVVLSSLTRERSVPSLALAIGNRIEMGIIGQTLSAEAPKLWLKVQASVRSGNFSRQSAVLRHLTGKAARGHYGDHNASDAIKDFIVSDPEKGDSTALWDHVTKAQIGLALLDIIAKTTSIVSIRRGGMDRPDTVTPTQEVLEWIRGFNNQMSLMSPVWCPLPIPPKDWTSPWEGGYHSSFMPKYKLIGKASKPFLEEVVANGDLSKVYRAVNTAQRTAWKINLKVYEVAKIMWENRYDVHALPDSPDIPIPACPVCGLQPTKEERMNSGHACFKEHPEALSEWKDATRRVYEDRISNASRCIETAHILEAARKLALEEQFYFPYYLDFRGRLYCRVAYLSPQGSGLGKSLLEFAEGKPIGNQAGADWLAVHVANSFGHDKCSFAERIQWTKDNTEMLLAIADNPLDMREHWANLSPKEAWPALASAFDWAGYIRGGFSYVSHLPIAQDGTCSGLQHYAAMLRDRHTAKQVNVAPGDRPSDVYAAVAEETKKRLESLVSDPEEGEMAMAWLATGIINRKLTKRSVMTLPYGSTLFTAKEYVYEYYKQACAEQGQIGPWKTGQDQIKACCWLGNHVWKAIGSVLTVAPVAMDILQKAARLMAGQGLPLNWETPSGFQVQQASISYTSRRIRLALSGDVVYTTGAKAEQDMNWPKEFRISLREPTDVLDEKRQASGVAPNFVHSLDASALMLTVCKMADEGYGSFALIHDSFAVHACDSARLASALREAFVEMYTEHDPLGELFDGFHSMLEAIGADAKTIKKLDALRKQLPYGDFDINEVKKSLYFFA